MKLFRSALSFSAIAALACGSAFATPMGSGVQVATGGAIANFTTTGSGTSTASISQYNSAAATASIVCPVGFTCGPAVLTEIDLGLTANVGGTVTTTNGGTNTAYIQCFQAIGGGACPTGNAATGTNGVALIGQLSFTASDPNTGLVPNPDPVLALTNIPAFTVNTSTTTLTGASKKDILAVTTTGSTYSGTGTASDPLGEVYSNTDANWLAESAAYVGGSTVQFALGLSGQVQPGAEDANVGTSNNIDNLNGTIVANYLFSYTETSTSATPEPSTMILMGGALLGAGLIRRRQVKRS